MAGHSLDALLGSPLPCCSDTIAEIDRSRSDPESTIQTEEFGFLWFQPLEGILPSCLDNQPLVAFRRNPNLIARSGFRF
jgi:hypothetical protein